MAFNLEFSSASFCRSLIKAPAARPCAAADSSSEDEALVESAWAPDFADATTLEREALAAVRLVPGAVGGGGGGGGGG